MNITSLQFPGPEAPFADLVDAITAVATAGFARAWVPQLPTVAGMPTWDALTTLAVAGQRAPDIGLGTSVVIAHTAHPLVLARQALTTSAAVTGRLTLGIGLSHAPMMAALGLTYAKPVAFLREYLEVLVPALAGEPVEHHGERITAVGQVVAAEAPVPPILLAALGPLMLDLAGSSTAGTMTSWANAVALERHIVPRITKAAEAAGRPAPQVVANLPVAVTDDVDGVRTALSDSYGVAGTLPAYEAVLAKGGAAGIGDVGLFGTEEYVTRELHRLADVGVTEFVGTPFGDAATVSRTTALLADVNAT
jgi:F420-dependent oxidoreductase-like protein